MTQAEIEKLEELLKQLKAIEHPDLAVKMQIHSIEELLKKK